jgi:antibiotic biosynthesis monooxygenase (ABM) superfamily enzyme
LTMTVPPLLKPVFSTLPWLGVWPIGHLVTASVIVGLVTYWIMPYYVRAISRWMFS